MNNNLSNKHRWPNALLAKQRFINPNCGKALNTCQTEKRSDIVETWREGPQVAAADFRPCTTAFDNARLCLTIVRKNDVEWITLGD